MPACLRGLPYPEMPKWKNPHTAGGYFLKCRQIEKNAHKCLQRQWTLQNPEAARARRLQAKTAREDRMRQREELRKPERFSRKDLEDHISRCA